MALLVLDEELGSARLAGALAQRGFDVTTVDALGLAGAPDDELLAGVDARCTGPWVLVTTGHGARHAPGADRHGHAVAWIGTGQETGGAALEQATVDVVHRQAPAIAAQRAGQRRTYTARQRREQA